MKKFRMKDSILFRRVMSLVLFCISLSALLTSVLFYPLSGKIFLKQRSRDMNVTAMNVSLLMDYYDLGVIDTARFQSAVQLSALNSSSEVFVYNFNDNTVMYSISDQSFEKDYHKTLDTMVQKIDASKQSASQMVNGENGQSFVLGVPVLSSDNASIIGVVFISQSMESVNAARNSLYITLCITVLSVSIIMLIGSLIVTRRINRPIAKICEVADSMAKGDFTVRADESQPLEFGDMARSLNHLSARLSNTISELVLERNRLKQILDGLSEGILALDKDGRVTHYNPTMAKFLGHSPALLADRDSFLQDSELWHDFDTVLSEACTVVRTFRWKNRIIRVDISAIVDTFENCVGAVGLFRDITETERLEQTRRDYVANVSHELRTPISAIRSLTETLMDGIITNPEDIQRYYSYLLSESMRLSRLVDDLLELSRLQSSNTAFTAQQLSIFDLFHETAERVFPIINERDITLVIDAPEGCPDAFANEDRIEQILMILLDNASKFTDAGGTVTLSAHWDSELIQIDVQDTGCGIAEEDLPHVFDRFYKADKAHSETGTGLGLSICREIISLMNQKIWVTSQKDVGATFSFTLARYDQQAPEET